MDLGFGWNFDDDDDLKTPGLFARAVARLLKMRVEICQRCGDQILIECGRSLPAEWKCDAYGHLICCS